MKIATSELAEAFKIVDQVASHAGILASQYLKLSYSRGRLHLGITGLAAAESIAKTDNEDGQWEFFADRRLIGAFLGVIRGKTIDLQMEKTRMRLLSGSHKVNINPVDAVSGYSTWKPGSKKSQALKLPVKVRNDLGMLAQYAPTTAAADHLTAIYLVRGYGMLATDSFTLAACLDGSTPVTFPMPVILSQLVKTIKADGLEIEKEGAGIKFDNRGHIFQTVSARCLTDYPLDAVQKLVNATDKMKPLVEVVVGKLAEGFQAIKNFIFGSGSGIKIVFSGGALILDQPWAKTTRNVEVIRADKVDLKWPIDLVIPWVEHIRDLDHEVTLEIGTHNNSDVFRAKIGKKKYILAIAQTTE